MNITDVSLTDPRMAGVFADPFITIHTDEVVEEIGDPIFDPKKSHEYRLVPCGPFYAPEFRPDVRLIHWHDMVEFKRADYGELNKLGLVRQQLFPVTVITPEDELDLCMEVPRLRRLMRSRLRGDRYRLVMDEEAALRSLLKWRLELSEPTCYGGATPREAFCGAEPIQTLIHKETHLPLCQRHLTEHQNRLANARRMSKQH